MDPSGPVFRRLCFLPGRRFFAPKIQRKYKNSSGVFRFCDSYIDGRVTETGYNGKKRNIPMAVQARLRNKDRRRKEKIGNEAYFPEIHGIADRAGHDPGERAGRNL